MSDEQRPCPVAWCESWWHECNVHNPECWWHSLPEPCARCYGTADLTGGSMPEPASATTQNAPYPPKDSDG